ncbi:hypothetical protein FQN54_001329 [Arachnomyces sp. PD_36]|nr:hypothetical protein FQN54_001329 [Arachnomyces sp. PD_36]
MFRLGIYVALKINVAENNGRNGELKILQQLQKARTHSGTRHIQHLLDYFEHTGPNGTHTCLVLEILGCSVKDRAERFRDGRYPGHVARRIAKQVLRGLEYLHHQGVAHGDLHPANILFAITDKLPTKENDVYQMLGKPVTAEVTRLDGDPTGVEVPKYLIEPTTFPAPTLDSEFQVKLTDLGEAFTEDIKPVSLHCPLVFRPPEVIFNDTWDHRVDTWSMGCTLFELIVGYPPFDNIFQTKEGLVREMIGFFGELPQRWKDQWQEMNRSHANDHYELMSLEEWLRDTYFDDDKKQDLSQSDINSVGIILQQMMRFEPTARPSIGEILGNAWFRMDSPFPR